MTLNELRAIELNLTEKNHLTVVNRLWREFDHGSLNLSFSVVQRILHKCKEYSPVNSRIDDMLIEHKLSWRKVYD